MHTLHLVPSKRRKLSGNSGIAGSAPDHQHLRVVGHLGMADIGRERSHGVVDIGPMLMPKLDAAADEGMAQVVDARMGIGAARRPAEFGSQLLEHPMDGPRR